MYTATDTGVSIGDSMPLAAIGDLIEASRQNEDRYKWIQADALSFVEDKYHDSYSQVLDETNWTTAKVNKYIAISRKVAPRVRRANVGFWNHYEVRNLSEAQQDHALGKLASKEWSRDNLRDWKRELEGDNAKPETQEITLRWNGELVHGLTRIGATFDKPDDKYEIIGFKAIVIERKQAPQADSERLAV
jgi:hypothetical protein